MVKKRFGNQVEASPKKQKTTKITSLDGLPEEILTLIASFLYQEDAVSLLLTSKTFDKPAKLRLYSKIIICEKHQDTYFYQLSRQKRITLLSSWDNILSFFKSIYLLSQTGDALNETDVCHYVEYIASYNYLDTGKLDVHRYLTSEDLQRILALRQYWDPVLNSFKNLKSFIFPKMPFERVIFLNHDIQSQLVELAINIENKDYNESTCEPLVFNSLLEKINLPNLKRLTINLDFGDYDIPDTIGRLFLSLLQTDKDQTYNGLLESLQINGKFGTSDRNLEHHLRHHKFDKDINLKSVFLKGFSYGEILYRDGRTVQSILQARRRRPRSFQADIFDDAESDDDEVFQSLNVEDNDAYDDEVYNGSSSDEDEQDGQDGQADNMYGSPAAHARDDELEPLMNRIEFADDNYNGYRSNSTPDGFIKLFKELDSVGFKLTNLKRLTLADLETLVKDEFHLWCQSTKRIIPNWENLEVLNIKNCYLGFDTAYEGESVQNLQRLSLLRFFTDEVSITNLKSLCYSLDLNDFQLEDEGMQLLAKDVELDHHLMLTRLINRNVGLKNFKFVANKYTRLKDLYQILKLSQTRSIQHITYLKPTEILSLCRRLLNIKIFKRFKTFENLNIIDDYYFGISKHLIEHFNSCSRVDDYYNDNDNYECLNTSSNFIFKGEFEYLFKEQVVDFFKLLPSLQTFTYLGYTFQRKNCMY